MRTTRRFGGSQVVTGAPSGGEEPAGISIPVGNCHAAVSAVIAVQTSSGGAGRATSRLISNSRLMAGLLRVVWVVEVLGDARVQRDHEAVGPAARRALVVVLGDEAVDRLGELSGERGPVARGREPNLAVDAEGRKRLSGRSR